MVMMSFKDPWYRVRDIKFDPNSVTTTLFKLGNGNTSLKHTSKLNLEKKATKSTQVDYVLSKNAFEIDNNENVKFHVHIDKFYSNMAVGICAETKNCKLKSNCNIDGIYMIGLWNWQSQQVINYNPKSRKCHQSNKIGQHSAILPKDDDYVTFLFDFQSEEYNGCIRLIHTSCSLADDLPNKLTEINCYETKNCDIDFENYNMMPFVKNLKNLNIKQYKLIVMIPDINIAINDINYNYNSNYSHRITNTNSSSYELSDEGDELRLRFNISLDSDHVYLSTPAPYRWLPGEYKEEGGWYHLLGTEAGSGNGMHNDSSKYVFIKYPELDYGLGCFEGSFPNSSYGIFAYMWTYIGNQCLSRICPQNRDVMRLIRTSLIVYSRAFKTSDYPNKELWYNVSLLTVGIYSFHFMKFIFCILNNSMARLSHQNLI